MSTSLNPTVVIPDPNPVDEAEEEAESAAVTALLAGAKTGTPITNTLIYRAEKKSWYVVARNFFLLLLNFSAWPCLGPA